MASNRLNYQANSAFKEYYNIFDSSISIILLRDNIVHIPFVDAIVNCTGKKFEHGGNFLFILKQKANLLSDSN